ncbi:hypothetical protein [Solicola gregarius]|uniref:Uncharacterized protein n=1 Tax=Solicola gregarius TaxID=2908642 RepID=A0AA46TIQ4_9ACTN|nr:hypothetical protein [Solicola gregarius]UYM05582.1 hypothetical protein L0C25_00395 [Solicola gregarius]
MVNQEEVAGWVRGRLPDAWFTEPAEVTTDREEITIVGRIAPPDGVDADDQGPEALEAIAGRISRFREDTRDDRIAIAREAERRFRRKVAWGVECGPEREVFTNLSVPVMTRLRQPERMVLDTLVDAGVARSRSHALAWSVRMVGENTEEWLGRLREAMSEVERVRDEGPTTE